MTEDRLPLAELLAKAGRAVAAAFPHLARRPRLERQQLGRHQLAC
jgi:hypothetical protein